MYYDYKKEYLIWLREKKKEEELMRKLGTSDNTIAKLRKFDYDQFNANRRFHRRNRQVDNSIFINAPSHDIKQVISIEDLLDELENEILYEKIKSMNSIATQIIMLKYQGFSVREIANITGLSIDQINYQIKKIKKILKKGPNSRVQMAYIVKG